VLASSIACSVMVSLPRVTVSVPTVPEAEEESPYEIFHFALFTTLNDEDLEGSKILCPEATPLDLVAAEREVDQT